MTARFSERAGDAAEALMGDTSFGMAARCAAINADMGDEYVLPVQWVSYRRADVGHLPQPPFYEIFTRGTTLTGLPIAGSNEFDVGITVKAWLPDTVVHADPDFQERLYERLERAFFEILIERVRYGGRTLNDASDGRVDNVRDIRVEPMVQWQPGTTHMGGIGALCSFTVTVAEEDTV